MLKVYTYTIGFGYVKSQNGDESSGKLVLEKEKIRRIHQSCSDDEI